MNISSKCYNVIFAYAFKKKGFYRAFGQNIITIMMCRKKMGKIIQMVNFESL